MLTSRQIVAMDSLSVLETHLQEHATSPLDLTMVDFTVQPEASTVTITSRETSTDNRAGRYSGASVLAYQKMDLGEVLPYPLRYTGPWPTTFGLLSTYLRTTYGILIEANDFALTGNTASGSLADTGTVVDAAPSPTQGTVDLVAQSTSARFTAGSILRVLIVPSNGPIRLDGISESLMQSDALRGAFVLNISTDIVSKFDPPPQNQN